eukprot:g34205.t1
MGVNGFETDVSGDLVIRDVDGEVQEEEGGIRNGPCEFEGTVEGVGEIDELFELLMGTRDSTDIVINVVEKEGLNVHGEDEVLGAGELQVLEKVEGMGCIPNVGGEFLVQRGKNGVQVVDGLGDDDLVIRGGVVIEGMVGEGVRELVSGLSDLEISLPYYHCGPLLAGLMARLGLKQREKRAVHSDGERL